MYRDSKFYCETLFGPRTSDRRNVFNFSMLFSMVVLNACGIAANVLIHRSVSVWNKAWGLVVANAIYVTEIVLVIVLIVNLHSGDNFWPLKLMMWYMLLVLFQCCQRPREGSRTKRSAMVCFELSCHSRLHCPSHLLHTGRCATRAG